MSTYTSMHTRGRKTAIVLSVLKTRDIDAPNLVITVSEGTETQEMTLFPSFEQLQELHTKLGEFLQVHTQENTCENCSDREGEECGIDGHEVYSDSTCKEGVDNE